MEDAHLVSLCLEIHMMIDFLKNLSPSLMFIVENRQNREKV